MRLKIFKKIYTYTRLKLNYSRHLYELITFRFNPFLKMMQKISYYFGINGKKANSKVIFSYMFQFKLFQIDI